MADQIRVGIIGAGSERGWARVSHIPALQASNEYQIVAVAGSSQDRAVRSAHELGVPLAFGDYRELVLRPEIDLVVVAVNVTLHREMVAAALSAGKMVYSEWPLGRDLSEAAELSALAAAKDIRTAIGLQGRFAPAVRLVRDLLASGEIGRVLGTSIRGVGPDGLWHGKLEPAFEIAADITNGNTLLAIPVGHVLDMLMYVLGEFASVNSALVVGRSHAIRTRDGMTVPVTAHDQVAIAGTLVSGALASIHYHGGEPRGSTFEWQINGDKGDLRILAPRGYGNINALEVQRACGNAHWEAVGIPASYVTRVPKGLPETAANVYALYEQFALDLRTGSKLASDFRHALRHHTLLDAIEQASRTGMRQSFGCSH